MFVADAVSSVRMAYQGWKFARMGAKALAKGGTSAGKSETVQRWMSRAELEATRKSGLLRGGRKGTHYVTDSANRSAIRARQRLALDRTPDVRVTLEVPAERLSVPTKVKPLNNMPGGGFERTATGDVPVSISKVDGVP